MSMSPALKKMREVAKPASPAKTLVDVIAEGYMPVEQAAAYLQLTVRQFNVWAHTRKVIPDARILRRRLYTRETLERVIRREGPDPFLPSGRMPGRKAKPRP